MQERIPFNIVTGFLGVGKTTVLRQCLQARPPGERWAVVVNEAGAVGIDGAMLEGRGAWVREIAGGCICCTGGPVLPVTLTRLVRELRPQRILLEPSGIADPARVLDLVQGEHLRALLQPMALMTLVDIRQFCDPQFRNHPVYRDQVSMAEILVAHKVDMASADQLRNFHDQAAALFPAKRVVGMASQGQIPLEWLQLDTAMSAETVTLSADVAREDTPRLIRRTPMSSWQAQPSQSGGTYGCGWRVAADTCFASAALLSLFVHLPDCVAPAQLLRAKGVFYTEKGWRLLQWAADHVSDEPIAWRRDSRVEVLTAQPVAWLAVERQLRAAVRPG